MAIDPDHLAELFAAFGPVSVRRMFGGAGLYADGVMFALESDGALFFKADAETSKAYEAENCAPFSYDMKGGRRTITSYWRLPERLLDEPDELAAWARRALAVARAKKAAGGAKVARSRKRRAS